VLHGPVPMCSCTYARIVKEDILLQNSTVVRLSQEHKYEFVSNFGNVDHRNCNNHNQKCP